MNVELRTIGVVLVFAATTVMISGCLSKEDSGADASFGGTTPPQNSAPTISGSADNAVMVGAQYEFTPAAQDADGDDLTFGVESLPGWATFDSSTGEVSGQPLLGDIGVYEDIIVNVTDGLDTTSLPPFSITVVEGALGSMTLSWTAPQQNTDGTDLIDLAGFRLYYGVTEGRYTHRVEINTTGMATHVVENLLPDTYYVVATAINTEGVESTYSNVVTRIVDAT